MPYRVCRTPAVVVLLLVGFVVAISWSAPAAAAPPDHRPRPTHHGAGTPARSVITPAEAHDAARSALDRVRSAPSARTLHMLQLIATRLAPYRQDKRVRELTQEIAEVA